MRCYRFIVVGLVSVVLLCGGCSGPVLRQINCPPTTAILGAFDEEVIILQGQLAGKKEYKIKGIRFATGKLNNRNVVIAWTGTGKVNAAMTTTLVIEHFRPSEIIFAGIAGGINPQLSPGDIVIARKTVQHDLGILRPTGLENQGGISPVDGIKNPVFYPADERLLKLAESAAQNASFEKMKTTEGERPPKIIEGIIATGDVFVASPAKCRELRKNLNADAVEMEGAAVAQVCYLQNVPCIVIRSITDKADEKAFEDLDKFLKITAGNLANLIVEMTEHLNNQVKSPVEKDKKSR